MRQKYSYHDTAWLWRLWGGSLHSSGPTLSIRWQSAKNMILGHFLTSDVIVKSHYSCRICDLAYRSNETFFSRTLRFSISRPAWPLRVRSINDKNDDENAAHVRNGMVLWRSPETVVSRTASRVATTIVAEIVLFLFLTISFLKIFSIVISPSYWTLHQQ